MTKQAVVDEPLPSVENGNDNDEKQSIWASILRDVKLSTKTAPATKSLVVLGDNETGRTTLIAKLQGNDDPKRGAGLEYHYIDVKDDDRDDTPKLGVWILDGDVACSAPLLKFAIKPETIENTILILVATMTQPWSLLTTLKKWTTLIEEHIDRLKLDPIRLREMRDHLQYDFQHYIEPNDSTIMLTSSASSATIKNGVGSGRVPNSVSSVSIASTTTPLSPINADEQIVLPLPDGVLIKSLGIPVIVVITKCDVMSALEKENDYKDEYFDFMQHHLRKFCLEYGAALFYTSVKEKKNIDKLYKYIVHKCYGYPFTSSAAIVERDGIFIPSGWDNPKKADILLENLHRIKSTDNYSDVFVKPVVRRPLQRDNEIIAAEDDQEFLAKLQLTLNRPTSPGKAEDNQTPMHPRSSISNSTVSQTPSAAVRQRNPPNPSPGNAATAANEGALANFFNSLLTRKSGGAVTPTSAGTPVTQRQTSQSPTTPSSKRLQQHPLTFTVTPPPARTKTPTSLKAFPSVLNTDSPPKLLSPVVEQQNKVETTSAASPIDARTPVEDKQLITTNNEQQANDALRLEKEPVTNVNEQNTEPIISQHDSVSHTINNSDIDTLNPPSQSSSLIENNLNIAHDALSDDNHRRLSNDMSLSAQSPITERPISPSQSDELSKTEHQNNVASTNRSRSPSPIINNNNKLVDRSPIIDQKSPGRASSPTFENIEQLNNKEDNEKQHDDSKQSLNSIRRNSVISPPTKSRPLNPVSNELQQQEDKALSSSAEHMIDLPSENELSHETLLSDVRKSESPIRSRPVSPTILETSELTSTDQEQNNPLLSATEQTNNSNIPADVLDEDSLTNKSPRLLSISDVNTSEHEHQDQIPIPLSDTNNNQNHSHSPVEISEENINSSPVIENHNSLKSPSSEKPPSSPTNGQRRDSAFTEDNQQKSPMHETALSLSSIPQNSEYTKDIGSPTFESNDIKRDFDENTTSLPITDTKYERSRSPSPTILQEQNRSISPVIEQKQQRSRSPSPSILQEQEQNQSVSPVTEQKQQRSRSPSPTIVQEQEQNRSVSPVTEQKQQRSRSPSPSILQEQEQNQSISSLTEQKQQRSRSPSPTIVQEQEQNRSVSPVIEQKQQRSRSTSPSILQDQEQNRSVSPVTEQKQQRSRSPSLINEQKGERSRSPSPIPNLNQEINRSLSPIAQQEQQRSRSPSPTLEQKHEQDENASLAMKHNLEQNHSESPIHEQNQQRSKSPSFDNGPSQLNNRPLSPVDHNPQGNQSTSVSVEQEQERNRSPSPVLEEKRERSRSPSPNAEKKQEQNPSSSPSALEENHEKNRTPSPVVEQRQERSRSSSPSTQQNQQRSESPSVNIEQQQERNRSSSPSTEQKEEQGLPLSSPSFDEQKKQTNRSPSPTTRQEQQRSRSPLPITQQKEQRSRSPSPSIEQNSKENEDSITRTSDNHETETQSANKGLSSPIIDHQEEQQLKMPASPIIENERRYSSSQLDDNTPKAPVSPLAISPKLEENKSPQLSTHFNHETTHNPNEIVASSPIIEQKQVDRSRSPSPKTENEEYSKESLHNNNEQLKKSPLSSPLTEKSLLIPSPTDRHETSLVGNKIENQSSPLTENHSTQPTKSPVNENIPSTQRSSIDHHHDHNPSPIPIPPVDRQPSITRSQSQSTIARPNTLRFSPNNHDLDGLYMTNDYNDEDEITAEDNEYHHNSAPSTVSVEYRRSSLLHDNNIEQKHTPIDPNDISKRLSIVENSRTEDNDNNVIDPTNSKGT